MVPISHSCSSWVWFYCLSWEKKCRRENFFAPHCFGSSHVNMLGLALPSCFLGYETRSFPDTSQPPHWLKTPKALRCVSEGPVSLHTAGTQACAVCESQCCARLEKISEGSRGFPEHGKRGVIWKIKWQAYFLQQKLCVYPVRAGF